MFAYTSIYFDAPPLEGRAIDIWIPEKEIKPLVLYFIHGGGWKMGNRGQMHKIMHGFYAQGYPCISADYRLSGVTIADQLSDVRQGMSVARTHLAEHGLELPFILYGSSAGGHLALLAGLAAPQVCGDAFQGKAPAIAGIVAACAPTTIEPWGDIFPESAHCIQNAVGKPYEEARDLYRILSPAAHAGAHSPPLFFLLGACEHMFPNEQTVRLVDRLRNEGHPSSCRIYPHAEHGFFYDLTRTPQRAAFRDMLQFLENPGGDSH